MDTGPGEAVRRRTRPVADISFRPPAPEGQPSPAAGSLCRWAERWKLHITSGNSESSQPALRIIRLFPLSVKVPVSASGLWLLPQNLWWRGGSPFLAGHFCPLPSASPPLLHPQFLLLCLDSFSFPQILSPLPIPVSSHLQLRLCQNVIDKFVSFSKFAMLRFEPRVFALNYVPRPFLSCFLF